MATAIAPTPAYIEIAEGTAINLARTVVYRWKKDEDGEFDWVPVTNPPGVPVVIDCYRVDGESDRRVSDETFYLVKWSHLPDEPAQIISYADLKLKEAYSRWPGVSISSTRECDFWANVIKGQVGQGARWGLSVRRSYRTTGWNRVGADRRWKYVLRDGRLIGDVATSQPPLPVDGYRFPAKHQTAWELGMPDLADVNAPTSQQLVDLAEWALEVDPKGRLLTLIGCSARALIGTLLPAETIAFAVGASGSGKTTTQNFARGIDGPCPARMDADVQLSNPTVAGVETRIAGLHDLPAFADDLHPKPTDGPGDAARLAALLEMLIYSAANGGEMRARSTREARAKIGATIGGLPFVSAEALPLQNESAMRRMIHLAYERGELNLASLWGQFDERQKVLTGAGHSILRRLTTSLATDEAKRIGAMRKWEQEREQEVYDSLCHVRPNAPDEFLRSLAHNYARPLTGLWLLARAASDVKPGEDDTLVYMAMGYVLDLAAAQLDLMAQGGPGQVNKEWIVATLRSVFAQGKAHVLDMDGARLASAPVSLTRLGYRGEFPSGVELGNLHDERETFYLIPGDTHTVLRQAALAERKGWTWTEATLPGYLVTLGLAMPEARGQNCVRVRIGGGRFRRLAIPFSYIFGDDVPPDETPSYESADKSSPSSPSSPTPSQGGLDCGTADRSPGTAPGTAQGEGAVPPSDAATVKRSALATPGTAGTAGTGFSWTRIEPKPNEPCGVCGAHVWKHREAGGATLYYCAKCHPKGSI